MNATLLLVIVLAYFTLLMAIAWFTSRGSDNEGFFVGNRRSKWWVVAFGMIGTSLTGVTFISVPGTVGNSGFSYFQVTIGYWLGYFIVAFVLLPLYYRMQLTSIYTYLENRLGVNAHKTGAAFFMLSRTVGSTLRLYLVIKVLEIFILKELNVSFSVTAVVILVLILLYTFRGGVKTIVWTDTLQTAFMLTSLIVGIAYLIHALDTDVSEAWRQMELQGLTSVFTWEGLSAHNFFKEIIGGAFITVAMTGLDQEMMQKNISVRRLKDSRKNMLVMGTLQMIVVFAFLFLGGLLILFAQQQGITARGDNLYPAVAIQSGLPFALTVVFVIGLISALFPSSDGALTAMTSSFCLDFLNMENRSWNKKKKLRVRWLVHVLFALAFLGFIFFYRLVDNGSLIIILLKLAGYTYGPLLGLFAFGILTRRKVRWKWPVLFSVLSMLLTLLLDLLNHPQWYIDKFHLSPMAGTMATELSRRLFHGYRIGYELLVINALITFALLYLVSEKASAMSVEGSGLYERRGQ